MYLSLIVLRGPDTKRGRVPTLTRHPAGRISAAQLFNSEFSLFAGPLRVEGPRLTVLQSNLFVRSFEFPRRHAVVRIIALQISDGEPPFQSGRSVVCMSV